MNGRVPRKQGCREALASEPFQTRGSYPDPLAAGRAARQDGLALDPIGNYKPRLRPGFLFGFAIRMSTPRIQLRTSHIGRDLVSYSIRASAAGAAIKRRGTGKWDRRVAQSFQGM